MVKKRKDCIKKMLSIAMTLVILVVLCAGINVDVLAQEWKCTVTDHQDPAMAYISSQADQEYAAQYIYLRVEGSDYAVQEDDVLTQPSFDQKEAVLDFKSFVQLSGDKILINDITLTEIYNNYDAATRNVCEVKINPLTRWGYLGIKLPTYADYRDLLKVEVQEGCKFPSLDSAQDGMIRASQCYVNQQAYVFVHPDMQSEQDIPDNAVKMSVEENAIVFTIKFNRFLLENCDQVFDADNYSYILLNGTPLSQLNDPERVPAIQWVSAKWNAKVQGDRLALVVTVPVQCSALINADYNYVGNAFVLKEGMKLPASRHGKDTTDTGSLRRSYRLGIYAEEYITEYYDETDSAEQYGTNQISGVTFASNDGTGEAGAMIRVTFAGAISNENVPAQGDYHVAANENAREIWGNADGRVYSKPFYLGFMHDGLKSSLLDNVYINGLSIAQWQTVIQETEERSVRWRAISIHYGEYGGKVMSIHFPADAVATKQKIIESYENGTLTVEFKPGLKFMTNTMVKTGQKFAFRKSTDSFVPVTTDSDVQALSVYYNGKKVENNSVIDGYGLIDKNSLWIPDDGNDYYVSFDTKANDSGVHVNVTVYLDKKIVFAFSIKGN